jgi:DNA-directed RNA polymerase specialized sigma24 family protein
MQYPSNDAERVFEAAYERYGARVKGIVRAKLSGFDRSHCEDVEAEVWKGYWAALGRSRQIDNHEALLCDIAKKKSADELARLCNQREREVALYKKGESESMPREIAAYNDAPSTGRRGAMRGHPEFCPTLKTTYQEGSTWFSKYVDELRALPVNSRWWCEREFGAEPLFSRQAPAKTDRCEVLQTFAKWKMESSFARQGQRAKWYPSWLDREIRRSPKLQDIRARMVLEGVSVDQVAELYEVHPGTIRREVDRVKRKKRGIVEAKKKVA